MNKLIIIIIIFVVFALNLVSALVESDKTYTFEVNKEDGYISHGDIRLFNSIFSERSNRNEGHYRVALANGDDVLYSIRFDLITAYNIEPSEECFTQINSSDCMLGEYIYDNSTGSVVLNFPYYPSANNIKVYDSGVLLFKYEFENRTENILVRYWHYFSVAALILLVLVFLIIWKRRAKSSSYSKQYA